MNTIRDFGELGNIFAPLLELIDLEDNVFESVKDMVKKDVAEAIRGKESISALYEAFNEDPKVMKEFEQLLVEIEKSIKTAAKSDSKIKFIHEVFDDILEVMRQVQDRELIAYDVEVPIQIVREGGQIPAYAHFGDDGVDIYACEDITVPALSYGNLIPTGIAMAIPIGWKASIKPRSGVSRKTHLRISNSIGTIDSLYRDELGVLLDNFGEEYIIKKGDRFAQIAIEKSYTAKFIEVKNIKEIGGDRGGGFGSSGK